MIMQIHKQLGKMLDGLNGHQQCQVQDLQQILIDSMVKLFDIILFVLMVEIIVIGKQVQYE